MLSAYVRILRPVNCIMMGFAVVVGAVLERGFAAAGSSVTVLATGYLTGFLLTASSMVLNDYYDRDTDSINEPTRPLPSGAISPRTALAYGILLTILGVLSSWILGKASFSVASAAWLLFLTYTLVGKKTGFLGNILVSLCVAVPFVYGAVILGNSIGARITIFASLAFTANLGREVNKGIVDIEGDAAKGVRTVAVLFGSNSASLWSALFYLVAVALSALPILWQMVSILYYFPFVLVTDLGLAFSAISILRKPSRENARSQKRFVLLWMFFGLIAFLVGSI